MASSFGLTSYCRRAATRLSLPRITVSQRSYQRPLPPASDTLELPPIDTWRKHFPVTLSSNHRVSLRNPDTAALLADAFVPEGSRDKVVLESYPGPGQLTRALMNLPKERISKIIVMEQDPHYLAYLRPLQEVDPRVMVLEKGGYDWDAYQHMDAQDILAGVQKVGWDEGVHPQLQFITHIPSSIPGEQLVAQLLRTIPDQQWLFQYGRVPLNFILSSSLYQRIISPPDDRNQRCKLSVIAQATSELTDTLPYDTLQPFSDHLHPARLAALKEGKPGETRKVGNPFQTLTVIPLEHQYIKRRRLDEWDFILRRMFVLKATAIKKGIPNLAPGAQSLLKRLDNPDIPEEKRVDLTRSPRILSVRDWSLIADAFHDWPFKPEDLAIDTLFLAQDQKNRVR